MTHTRPFSLPVSPDVFKQKRMKARHNVCKVLKRGLQEYLCSFKASWAGRMRGRVWLLRATSLSLEQPGSFLSLLWNTVTQRRRSFPEGVWIHVLAALWVWALRATNTSWKEHIWTGAHIMSQTAERGWSQHPTVPKDSYQAPSQMSIATAVKTFTNLWV